MFGFPCLSVSLEESFCSCVISILVKNSSKFSVLSFDICGCQYLLCHGMGEKREGRTTEILKGGTTFFSSSLDQSKPLNQGCALISSADCILSELSRARSYRHGSAMQRWLRSAARQTLPSKSEAFDEKNVDGNVTCLWRMFLHVS